MNNRQLSLLTLVAVCLTIATTVPSIHASSSSARQDNDASAAKPLAREFITTVDDAQLTLIDNVEIATRDPGVVTEISIREGDLVHENDILFRLDSELYKAELEAAKVEAEIAAKNSENDVDLRYAEKSAAVNETVLKRSQNAANQYAKSITRTELERLDLELQRSILSGEQALHTQAINALNLRLKNEQLKVARLRAEYREVASPMSGVVAEVFPQPGEWVAAGQPVARVINLKRLRVEALVGQQFAFALKPGQAARFEITTGETPITADGKIAFVSPEINPLSEEFLVWVDIDNSDLRFKPGLKGKLTLLKD